MKNEWAIAIEFSHGNLRTHVNCFVGNALPRLSCVPTQLQMRLFLVTVAIDQRLLLNEAILCLSLTIYAE